MSERITIDVVSEEGQWSNEYGTYQAYMLDVKTEDGRIVGNVQSNRKIKDDGSHNEPREGEEVWGTLESKKGGSYKLTLDTQRMKNEPLGRGGAYEASTGTSGGSKASPKGSGGEVDWDAKEARITRQAALKIVSPLLAEERGLSPRVRGIVEEIEQFVSEAPKRPLGESYAQTMDRLHTAQTDAILNHPMLNKEPPVDLSGARTEEPIQPKPSVNFHKEELPNQDLDDYRQLLSSAGLEPAAARDKVAEYMGVVLSKERLAKAVTGLQELERQGSVLSQLKEETEKWIKGPLPSPADRNVPLDDDIPF